MDEFRERHPILSERELNLLKQRLLEEKKKIMQHGPFVRENQKSEILVPFKLGKDDLLKIENSLARIDEGNYGICQECGLNIPFERLKVRLTSSNCVQCKEKIEKKKFQILLSHYPEK